MPKITNTVTATDLLDDAADLLEQRGWYQDGAQGPNGELCALSAISVATNRACVDENTLVHAMRAATQARAALRANIEPPHISVWNDHPDRTAAEVIQTLRDIAGEIA